MDQLASQHTLNIDVSFKKVENAAFEFNAKLEQTDRTLRKNAITTPSLETKQSVAAAYWEMFEEVDAFEKRFPEHDLSAYKASFRAIVSPWLCRSKFFWRSLSKPHGYAGDFKIIDWMYDLEHSAGEDPTEPGIVNCLDFIFSTNHSVISLWDRRRWLKGLLHDELKKKGELKILDIACGGARYIRDFLESVDDVSTVSVTLLDQDPAALAFAETVNLAKWPDQIETICAPIKNLTKTIKVDDYDVIISSGLFDYLDHETGSGVLNYLSTKIKQGGVLAITNYHIDDASLLSKDWSADWPLVFREDHHVHALFPHTITPILTRSENGSLIMAAGRKESV
jgi:extracellular factor (EF) 3-hydroxypalmitic acid methyl ester biosynthesis protein